MPTSRLQRLILMFNMRLIIDTFQAAVGNFMPFTEMVKPLMAHLGEFKKSSDDAFEKTGLIWQVYLSFSALNSESA